MSIGEFNEVFVLPKLDGAGWKLILCCQVSFSQTFNRSWVAEEGVDGFCLFLKFN